MLWLALEESGGQFPTTGQLLALGSSLLVFLLIVGTAAVARSGIGIVPRAWGAVYEHIFDWLDGLAQDLMGPEGRNYVPFAMTLFLYVLISNWSGMIPWPSFGEGEHALSFVPPSTSFNTTLALALISFFAFNLFGLKKRIFPPQEHQEAHPPVGEQHHQPQGGLSGLVTWIGHYWQPTPMLWNDLEGFLRYALVPLLALLFILLNIVEEVARIMSLSIRLYGNIFGESQVHHNLMATMFGFLQTSLASLAQGAVGAGLGMGVMVLLLWGASVFATCLGALAGFIQAMIFSVLTLSYIGHAVADEH